MSILDTIGSIFRRSQSEPASGNVPSPVSLTYANYGTIAERRAMLLSVVYRCVDLISNSVAQLPIGVYDKDKRPANDDLRYVLNTEPNGITDRYTLYKLIVSCMLLRGNSYLVIEREGDRVIALHYVAPDNVTIKVDTDDFGIDRNVYYVINGVAYESSDVIHIRNYSYNGIVGVSTISHAINSISVASNSEATALGFFSGGCNLGGILTVQGMLSKEQKEVLKQSWQAAFNKESGTPKGVAVLEGAMTYQPVTVSPSDAQLLESRQYNVVDICRFFGVAPTKAFDLTKSSYSTIEAEGIAFLSDTIQPILAKIESEFRRKLLTGEDRRRLSISFETSELIRTDKTSLAGYYSTLFNIGVMSQNDVRRALDMSPIEGGNKYYTPLNMGEDNNQSDNE